jgi:hypothetical protein
VKAKEIVERAKGETKGTKPKFEPVVKGPQTKDLFGQPVAAEPEPAKPQPKMRGRAVLDDFLHMFEKRPPTSDYVKGIADAIRYVCGEIEADEFSKAWKQYTDRVAGVQKQAKKAPKAKAKPVKAKAKKQAKKAKKK